MKKHELREFARGQDCTIELFGYCNNNPETVVLAHYRPGFYGIGMKPPDLLAAHACSVCHDIIDGRMKTSISEEDIEAAFHSGIVKTIQRITNVYEIALGDKKK